MGIVLLIYLLISWKNFPIVVHKSTMRHRISKVVQDLPKRVCSTRSLCRLRAVKNILNMLTNSSSIHGMRAFNQVLWGPLPLKRTGLQMSHK
jgi:hypothetical protein